MVTPEGNNTWTRNVYGLGKILPSHVNNEITGNGDSGVQRCIREIFHSRETAFILMETGSGEFAASGTYDDCDVAAGYIMTKDSDGLSKVVHCDAVTGLNINADSKCVVAGNDGVILVKEKASVLSTDAIIAVRSGATHAVTNINILAEDSKVNTILAGVGVANDLDLDGIPVDIAADGGSIDISEIIPDVQKLGSDAVGYRTLVLHDGDDLSDAVTILGGNGVIILLPGSYTDSPTLSNTITLMGSGVGCTTITGTVTLSGSYCTLENVNVVGRVVVSGSRCVVKNVKVTYSSGGGDGIAISNTYATVESCIITGNFSRGVYSSSAYTSVNKCYVTGITGTGGVPCGLYISSLSIVRNNTVCLVSATTTGSPCGIIVGACSIVSGNTVYSVSLTSTTFVSMQSLSGISIGGAACTAFGNTVRDIVVVNSNNNSLMAVGIWASGARSAISCNSVLRLWSYSPVSNIAYGIASSADNCVFTGNTVDDLTCVNVTGAKAGLSNDTNAHNVWVGNNSYTEGYDLGTTDENAGTIGY